MYGIDKLYPITDLAVLSHLLQTEIEACLD